MGPRWYLRGSLRDWPVGLHCAQVVSEDLLDQCAVDCLLGSPLSEQARLSWSWCALCVFRLPLPVVLAVQWGTLRRLLWGGEMARQAQEAAFPFWRERAETAEGHRSAGRLKAVS